MVLVFLLISFLKNTETQEKEKNNMTPAKLRSYLESLRQVVKFSDGEPIIKKGLMGLWYPFARRPLIDNM